MGKITISSVSVCDIYEVGNWTESYSWIKLGYKLDKYESKYSDISFSIKDENGIFGYVLTYNVVNINDLDIIPLYCKKLVIYDFAIDDNSYAKYGKMLINYLINYACNEGYSCIEVSDISKYKFFIEFINRHYKLKQYDNKFYFMIDNPKVKLSQKHLTIYEKDKVSIEDIYFLYNLKAIVLKTIIKIKVNNDFIVVDRLTGEIEFPQFIKILNDTVLLNNVTRNIIYFINYYKTNVSIYYDNSNPYEFEIYEDDKLYVSKKPEELVNDLDYVLNKLDNGIHYIYPYFIDYNMNDQSFGYIAGGMSCYDFIEKKFNEYNVLPTLKDRLIEKKKINEFNLKFNNIKRFDFRFGNSFGGIKKLRIQFDEDLNVSSNGQMEKNIILDKDVIIKELKLFNFMYWKNKYDTNPNPIFENIWSIRLVFDGEVIEYSGYDDYPKTWKFVCWFINKYSKFILNEE